MPKILFKNQEYEYNLGNCGKNALYIIIPSEESGRTKILEQFAGENQLSFEEFMKENPKIPENQIFDTIVIVAHGGENDKCKANQRFSISSNSNLGVKHFAKQLKVLINKMKMQKQKLKKIRLQMCYADSLKIGNRETFANYINKEINNNTDKQKSITISAPLFLSAVSRDHSGNYADFITNLDPFQSASEFFTYIRSRINGI